ncbi:hypothetical protein D3C87_1802420 [compost metagenome]
MNETGAVEEHIDLADLGDQRLDGAGIEHVEPVRFDSGFGSERCERFDVDIGGMHFRARLGEGKCGGAADALGGSRDKDDLARKTRCHC